MKRIFDFLLEKRDIFYIFILTAVSIAFLGYYVSYADDQLYLPALFQRLNPALYPNDYLLLEPLKTFTFITDLEILLLKFFGGNIIHTLFFMYFIAKFMLYYGIYTLSKTLFKNRLAAFAAVFVLFAPVLLPKIGMLSYELSVVPRMLVYGAELVFFSLILNGRITLAMSIWAAVALLHPVSAFHLAVVCFLSILLKYRQISRNDKIKIVLIILSVAAAFLVKQYLQHNSYQFKIWNFSQDWRDFFQVKGRYLFFRYWKITDWKYLGYILTPLLIFLVVSRQLLKLSYEKIKNIVFISLSVIVSMALSYLFVDLRPTPFFIRMEMSRTMIYWLYIGFIGLSGVIVMLSLKRGSVLTWLLAAHTLIAMPRGSANMLLIWFLLWLFSLFIKMPNRISSLMSFLIVFFLIMKLPPNVDLNFGRSIMITGGVILVFWVSSNKKLAEIMTVFLLVPITLILFVQTVRNNFPANLYYGGIYPTKIYWREYLQQKVYFPTLPNTDWFSAQFWVRDNVPPNSAILVPALVEPGTLTGFRVFSDHTVIYDLKDGAIGTYSDVFAKKWVLRNRDLYGNELFSQEKIYDLSKKYNFEYVLRSKVDPVLNWPVVYSNSSFNIYRVT